MTFLKQLKHAVLPGVYNAYRPVLLRKPALALYLAVVLAAEMFFIARLYHIEPIQALLSVDTAAAVAWILGSVVALLACLLAVAFFKHVHIQSNEILLPGTVVLVLSVLLSACNALYGLPASSVLTAAVVQSQVITLTNAQRQQHGVGMLAENILLDLAAARKAQDMAAKGYFAHVGPDGKAPWSWILESGYDYHYAGENLAVRFSESQDVVNAWVSSPAHYANIIKSAYTDIGVGTAQGLYEGQPAIYVVQFFASPMAK